MNPRFDDMPAFTLIGIRRHHKISDAARTVPQQWTEFRDMGLRSTRAPRAFGAFAQGDHESFEYMTAIEETEAEHIPDGIGRIHVPAQHYAVFRHEGHASRASQTWGYIMGRWLPNSAYEDAVTPPFELYGPSFDPATGDGGFEIWFPVRKKAKA